MEKFSLIFLLIITTITTTIAADISDTDPLIRQVIPEQEQTTTSNDLLTAEHHFTLFKTKFGKTYATQEEHDYRLSVFKSNLRRAKRHQLLDPTAEHGVTKFSDLTPSEFRKTYLGLKNQVKFPADANNAPILPTTDLPEEFDWRDHGAVTPVKNQVSNFNQ